MRLFHVSLDGSIDDGNFLAINSNDAVQQACVARGWVYSEEVYNSAQWEMPQGPGPLEKGLRTYTCRGREFKAHGRNCAEGFKTDRAQGLIYPPYQEDDGEIISVEKASRLWGFCAYCGIPREAYAI